VQLLLSRISYGLALFFLSISNLLYISKAIPFSYWTSNIDNVFERLIDPQELINYYIPSVLLILALVLVKKRLFAILIIAGNSLIVLIQVFRQLSYFDFPDDFSFLLKLKIIVKIMLGFGLVGDFSSWNFADITKILSAIFTIAGVIIAFTISNNNLPKLNPVSNQPTPPQARIIPKTATGITGDAVEQVEKLGNLLAKGLLTQEEFDSKKKQILGL